MEKQILVDQYLPSGCGFKVIRTDDTLDFGNYKNAIQSAHHYLEVKKWCQKNCTGIWGYTPRGENRADWSKHRPERQSIHHYFAFIDDEDITMVLLMMGLDSAHAKSMWPSRSKFTIFVR